MAPKAKAAGKRKASSKQDTAPATPAKKPRQRKSASTAMPPSIASPTATPGSATSAASAASSAASSPSSSASSAGSVYTLKVSLLRSDPLIWRRIRVHSSTDLTALHEVLQGLFEWQECHLHIFKVPLPGASEQVTRRNGLAGHRLYVDKFGDDSTDGEVGLMDLPEWDEKGVLVSALLPATGDRLLYDYDTGDGWQHLIEVESIEPATAINVSGLPRCVAGACSGPVEDSGGMRYHIHMVRKFVKATKAASATKREGGSSEAGEDAAEDDDEYPRDTVEDWLENAENRLGHKYDPSFFRPEACTYNIGAAKRQIDSGRRDSQQ